MLHPLRPSNSSLNCNHASITTFFVEINSHACACACVFKGELNLGLFQNNLHGEVSLRMNGINYSKCRRPAYSITHSNSLLQKNPKSKGTHE